MNTRRPIPRASRSRTSQLAKYRKLRTEFFRTHHICFVCKLKVPECGKSLHHYFGRTQELLCYVPGFRLVHSGCHDVIEAHRNDAVKFGWRAPDNLFGRPSKVLAL